MFYQFSLILISLINQLDCSSIQSSFDVELKSPTLKKIKLIKQDDFWFEHFLYILFNYSTLLIPILSIVYLVKNNLCFLPGIYF